MAVPKQKISKSKRGMRRAHKGLKKINVVVDQTTGEYKLPHHISLTDGYYNGEQVLLEKEDSDDIDEDVA
ncbi:MAG: 50S ribosomal protein L32 [Rickettsiales bacterium]|nr:50S ribosomal protein L32 [Rickettsiales bacterium]